MTDRFKLTKGNQAQGVQRILNKLDELVADPGFAPAYFEGPVARAEQETDRIFGATYLELLSLFHTSSGYHANVHNEEPGALLRARGFAHSLLAFQLYLADLRYVIANRMSYHPIGSTICLLEFARAVSEGRLEVADWWADGIQDMNALNPHYLLDSTADRCLNAHLLLLSRCWRDRRLPRAEEIEPELGIYRILWSASQSVEAKNHALDECAHYHLEQALTNDWSPFGSMPYGPYPVELLAVCRLYQEVLGDRILGNHPLFQTPIVQRIDVGGLYSDEWLDRVRARAKPFYGKYWPDLS